MSVTHSEHFDLDLSKATPQQRGTYLSEIIKLAREYGVEVQHRREGWTTIVNGERQNWWPAQINLFVDHLADEIREAVILAGAGSR